MAMNLEARHLEAQASERASKTLRYEGEFRVTIPAARPGIAAAAILILIGTWNEFLFAVILGNRNAVTITRLITAITNFPYRLNESPPPDLPISITLFLTGGTTGICSVNLAATTLRS